MGVYIKGMEMPKNCCDCPCYQDAYNFYPYCMAIEEQRIVGGGHLENDGKGRHKDCPSVEVPEPHGRLIDEDNVIDAIKEFIKKRGDIDLLGVLPYISKIPTVIEAEGEE